MIITEASMEPYRIPVDSWRLPEGSIHDPSWPQRL